VRLELEVRTYSGDDGISIPVVAAVLSRPTEDAPIYCPDCGFGPVELPSNLIAWCPACNHDWSYA
jgi:hypothetical protein